MAMVSADDSGVQEVQDGLLDLRIGSRSELYYNQVYSVNSRNGSVMTTAASIYTVTRALV